MEAETKLHPRISTLSEIEAVILAKDDFEVRVMEAVEEGFVQYSRGQFHAAPIHTMGAPPMAPFRVHNRSNDYDPQRYSAQTCVKSGYIENDTHFVIKVASGGYPMPKNTGVVQLFSQETGSLECLLLDDGMLTEHRTAAAGALAAKYLAPKNIQTMGILGSGVQARYQLRYLKFVTDCRDVLVWGRTPDHVQKFRDDMTSRRWNVNIASFPNALFENCDLIVTTTSAREPLLSMSPVAKQDFTPPRRAQHITCVGADAFGKMELDPALVKLADMLVADSRLQTRERGEFAKAIAQNMVSVNDIIEIGELVEKSELHRKLDDSRLTIFDTSGLAVQDCAIAKLVSRFMNKSNE
jgi:ornithine cyclodeaminase